MTFRFAHKLVTYVFATLGMIALMLGTTFTGPEAWVVVAGIALSWFAEKPLLDRPGYTRFWTYSSVVALLVQVLRSVAGVAPLTAGVQYAAFLQVTRLAHRKSAADYQQITLLGFLHLISGTVLSDGLDYAIVFFGFLIVMPWMLSLTHVRRELELRYGENTDVLEAQLESPEIATAGFFGGTTLLAVPLFFFTAALFFAFPRVGFGFLSSLGSRAQNVAGFGADVALGGFGTIRDDPTVVMRVKVPRMQFPPRQTIPLRLRGTSFDRYREGRWSRSELDADEVRRTRNRYHLLRRPTSRDREYQIILDPMEEGVIFLPEGSVALRLPPIVRSGRERYRSLFYSPGMDVRYRGQLEGALTYQAYTDPSVTGFAERVPSKLYRRYLELPENQERVAELARRVAGPISDPKGQVQRIEAFLRADGGFEYTLVQPDTAGKDPLQVFLFEVKAGHCEYFSTAMAMMVRALGLPARNVTGFLGADYNPYGQYYAVRNSNAHSWVEVLIDGKWQTFDPTPPSSQVAIAPYGLSARLGQMLDALRVKWSEYVVEYNIRDQVAALRGLAAWYRSLRRESGAEGAREDEDSGTTDGWGGFGFRPDWRWFFGVVSISAVGLPLIGWIRRRRKRMPGLGSLDTDQERAVRLYLSLEESLRRAGHPRPQDVTPNAYAGVLEESGFHHAKAVREVTDAYLAARFGAERLPAGEYQRLRRLTRQVRSL